MNLSKEEKGLLGIDKEDSPLVSGLIGGVLGAVTDSAILGGIGGVIGDLLDGDLPD